MIFWLAPKNRWLSFAEHIFRRRSQSEWRCVSGIERAAINRAAMS